MCHASYLDVDIRALHIYVQDIHAVSKHYATIQICMVRVNVSSPLLPLGFLPAQKLLQNSNPLFQSLHFLLQGVLHLGAVFAKLCVEVLPVRGGGHGSAEDGLDDEGVVGFEGVSVGLAEGV